MKNLNLMSEGYTVIITVKKLIFKYLNNLGCSSPRSPFSNWIRLFLLSCSFLRLASISCHVPVPSLGCPTLNESTPLKEEGLEPLQETEDKLGGFSRSVRCSSPLGREIVMFSETGVPGCEIYSSDSWISAAVNVSNVGSTSGGSEPRCFFDSSVAFAFPLAGVPPFNFTSLRQTKGSL